MTDGPRPPRRKCATIARHDECDGYGCAACQDTGRNPNLKPRSGATPTAPNTPKASTALENTPGMLERANRGRPSKLETHGKAILERIRKGMDDNAACERSDVHPHTLDRWLAKGYDAAILVDDGATIPQELEAYRVFLREYLDARHDLHERLLDRVSDLVPRMEPRDALAFLERMRRAKWGRVDTLTIGTEPGAGVPFTERYADTLAELLRGIIADLALTEAQAEQVPTIIARNLERVSARAAQA